MAIAAPGRLYFTDSDEANELIAREPLALLIGLALDQQVTVQTAFSGPLKIKERLGTLDAGEIASMDPDRLEAAFRERPAVHRFPGSMATRVRDLCAFVEAEYSGDAARLWTEAGDSTELRRRIAELPGFGEMKIKTLGAILAKRFGVAAAEGLAPNYPTLGDVDSHEALDQYQAMKREHKAKMRAAKQPLTYSIVARDPETGQLGGAVQSRAFNCGAGVLWAKPGIGAVATQAYGERSYGPLGLELLEAGKTPEQALAALVTADPDSAARQVAILSSDGTAAAHTGADCIPDAGHQVGNGYSVQANIMRNSSVWPGMAEAFEAATGSLARRMLATLGAAEEAGGDWRGMQAAGLLVIEADGKPWERVFDLRVEDHPEPLKELRRLLDLAEGYRAMSRVEDRAAAARSAGLAEVDVRFAEIVDAAYADDLARARELLAPMLAEEPRWASYVRVLGARGYLPHAEELLE